MRKITRVFHLGWFTKSYWKFLLEKPFNLTKFWCRARQHPYAQYWYNVGGTEPDYRCINCQDDLG
jgi:hypothetical protein